MATSVAHTLPDLTGAFVDEGYLQLVQLLGCGSNAKVYKALDTTSPCDDPAYYAVKCMKNCPPGSRQTGIYENEFKLHDVVSDHPGVITFHRTFADADFVYVVLDLSAGGDMLEAIVKRQVYVGRPALIKEAFIQLLDTVAYCHQNGVYHRDLKPQNILCNSAGTDIRLADLDSRRRGKNQKISDAVNVCREGLRILLYARFNIWGLAVVLVNLTCGTLAWPVAEMSDTKYAAFRAEDDFLLQSLYVTPEANDLFRWCFSADPEQRPTLTQLRAAVLEIEYFTLADLPCYPPSLPVPRNTLPALPAHADLQLALEKRAGLSVFPHSAIFDASAHPSVLSAVSSMFVLLISGIPTLESSTQYEPRTATPTCWTQRTSGSPLCTPRRCGPRNSARRRGSIVTRKRFNAGFKRRV
ncbi:kinase-like domain-containing protein [Mycena sp. CBHHK59/15]|nr:kinase-like domain-containing protein [Mycena sp. CBHHK59/15]